MSDELRDRIAWWLAGTFNHAVESVDPPVAGPNTRRLANELLAGPLAALVEVAQAARDLDAAVVRYLNATPELDACEDLSAEGNLRDRHDDLRAALLRLGESPPPETQGDDVEKGKH